MADHLVVLNRDDPLAFVASACAALADEVNTIRAVRGVDGSLAVVYAEMVLTYARLHRRQLVGDADSQVRLAIIDHLIERLHQALEGDLAVPLADIVDRLHGEIAVTPVPI